jgi:hypothetical protein
MGPPAVNAGASVSSAVQQIPLKQKMTVGFKSLINGARKLAIGADTASKATLEDLFPKVDKAADGDDCDRDCDSCAVHYPKNFKVEESDTLYGFVKGWSTHVLVATGKADWVRDVADEKGSVMQAIDHAKSGPSNGVCLPAPLPMFMSILATRGMIC